MAAEEIMRLFLILSLLVLNLSCSIQTTQEVIGTDLPTEIPTDIPTEIPTEVPTDIPTDTPTEVPTSTPIEMPCAPGAQCIQVDDTGHPSDTGLFVAQCSGQFPDYVDRVPYGE